MWVFFIFSRINKLSVFHFTTVNLFATTFKLFKRSKNRCRPPMAICCLVHDHVSHVCVNFVEEKKEKTCISSTRGHLATSPLPDIWSTLSTVKSSRQPRKTKVYVPPLWVLSCRWYHQTSLLFHACRRGCRWRRYEATSCRTVGFGPIWHFTSPWALPIQQVWRDPSHVTIQHEWSSSGNGPCGQKPPNE